MNYNIYHCLHNKALTSPMTSKTKLKIQFFQHQLNQLLQLQQRIQKIRSILKQLLSSSTSDTGQHNPNYLKQLNSLKQAEHRLKRQVQLLKKSIIQTRQGCNLVYDQAKIEGDTIFHALEHKVQQLNQRLFVAENSVQYAEGLKRQYDQIKVDYQMSNNKGWKFEKQARVLQRYVESQNKLVEQFRRSINLMMKIRDRYATKNENSLHNQFHELLRMRADKLSYAQMRRQQAFGASRNARSLQHYNSKQHQLSCKKIKNQPLLCLLLKSQSIPYKSERQMALKRILFDMRKKNKEQTLVNKIMQKSLSLKDRQDVLRYLEKQSSLNEEQSIRKVELMHEKFQNRGSQRMLGLKLGKVSKGDEVIKSCRSIKIDRRVRSLGKVQEIDIQQQKHKWMKSEKVIPSETMNKVMENPSLSKTKTNDSLTKRHMVY